MSDAWTLESMSPKLRKVAERARREPKARFHSLAHRSKLLEMLRERVPDGSLLRLVGKCLRVGVLDGEEFSEPDGGTTQGSVISPLLANLFLHYAFDVWMKRRYPQNPWVRYADDGLVHCRTRQEAEKLLEILKKRFEECKLALHPEKTRIVYCKDDDRRADHPNMGRVIASRAGGGAGCWQSPCLDLARASAG